ncbi:hypothetical protein JKP88DRAFT_240825 [Tribonema minus]|uniref:Uncharacterized protein n=1 Tax=Tribonema minus TaxID=303371 RepID=A0A835Z4C6_9STRA|nr:hypothetical protein JKP88DRAFT_240825 [Tribonema minus]
MKATPNVTCMHDKEASAASAPLHEPQHPVPQTPGCLLLLLYMVRKGQRRHRHDAARHRAEGRKLYYRNRLRNKLWSSEEQRQQWEAAFRAASSELDTLDSIPIAERDTSYSNVEDQNPELPSHSASPQPQQRQRRERKRRRERRRGSESEEESQSPVRQRHRPASSEDRPHRSARRRRRVDSEQPERRRKGDRGRRSSGDRRSHSHSGSERRQGSWRRRHWDDAAASDTDRARSSSRSTGSSTSRSRSRSASSRSYGRRGTSQGGGEEGATAASGIAAEPETNLPNSESSEWTGGGVGAGDTDNLADHHGSSFGNEHLADSGGFGFDRSGFADSGAQVAAAVDSALSLAVGGSIEGEPGGDVNVAGADSASNGADSVGVGVVLPSPGGEAGNSQEGSAVEAGQHDRRRYDRREGLRGAGTTRRNSRSWSRDRGGNGTGVRRERSRSRDRGGMRRQPLDGGHSMNVNNRNSQQWQGRDNRGRGPLGRPRNVLPPCSRCGRINHHVSTCRACSRCGRTSHGREKCVAKSVLSPHKQVW